MENKILWPGWETVRLIGRGSYGAVYEIERELYEGEKEKAALKVISIPHNESEVNDLRTSGYDDRSITRIFEGQSKELIKEYALMNKLRGHTNIVNCQEFRHVQQEDGLGWDVYIRMELLEPFTSSLGSVIEEKQVAAVGKDLCRALILCRKYNIIHRDIKPQNIFVSDTGDYKLGDFGIARTMEQTSGATSIGTHNYMAPEVAKGLDYGHRADIYSLGLVLYWMLNERRLPFLPLPPQIPTSAENELALKRRRSGENIPAPKNGSDALKTIVLKACAYDSKDRYNSADEMLAALNTLSLEPAAGEDTIIKKNSSKDDTIIEKEPEVPVVDKILWPGWKTVRLIGRGTTAAVYEIERDIFGEKEKAALKVIRIPQDDGFIQDLINDGYDKGYITSLFNDYFQNTIVKKFSLMRKMNGSANVVNWHDARYAQHEDGIGLDVFIKMELLTPLPKALPSKISEDMVIKVAKDLCHALVLCKKYDIVHRDIKPQNIFVSENGDYKLGEVRMEAPIEDGPAEIAPPTYVAEVYTGHPYGVGLDVAPEVYTDHPHGVASDIYSLGLVLYWLLNERREPFLPLPPKFPGASDVGLARQRRLKGENLPAPANGSAALKAIVLKACAYKPEDRYATADEMLAALNALRDVTVIIPQQPENPEEDEDDIPAPPFFPPEDNTEFSTKNGTMGEHDNLDVEEDGIFSKIATIIAVIVLVVQFVIIPIIVVVGYFSISEEYISRIITGNMILSNLYENTRPVIQPIQTIIMRIIGTSTNDFGPIVDQWGRSLNPTIASANLRNACLLILPSLVMLIVPVVTVVKKCAKVFSNQRDGNLKEKDENTTKRIVLRLFLVVVYILTFEAFISRIITGNIMLAFQYENIRPVVKEITQFLRQIIGATQDAAATVTDRWGRQLNPSSDVCNLRNACYLILPSLYMLVYPIIAGIKKVARLRRQNSTAAQHR